MSLREHDKENIYNSIKNNNLELFKNLTRPITDLKEINFDIKYDLFHKFFCREKIPILHLVAALNLLDFFKYLHVEKQIPLRFQDAQSYFSIDYACFGGAIDVFLYILNEDPEECLLPQDQRTPLLYSAALGGNVDIFKALMNNGCKITDPWIDKYKLFDKAMTNLDIFTFLLSQCSSKDYDYKNGSTLAIQCVNNHHFDASEIAYRGLEDITAHLYNRSKYICLIGLICQNDVRNQHKKFLLRIIEDAIKFNVSIDPPKLTDKYCEGVCHWACIYNDLDVAKAMFRTKDFDINRINEYHLTGATRLIGKRNNVADMIELLIQNGFDVNYRFDSKIPSLLESFITAISKNYEAIETLIQYGADIHQFMSRKTDRNGNPVDIAQYVKEKGDSKLKRIFNNIE